MHEGPVLRSATKRCTRQELTLGNSGENELDGSPALSPGDDPLNSQRIHELGSVDNGTKDQRPVERFCDLLLRESISGRFAALRLVLTDGKACAVQALAAGEWTDIFRLPIPVYSALTTHLKVVAGLLPTSDADQEGRFVVRESHGDTTIDITVRRNAAGVEEFFLDFSHAAPADDDVA